MLEIIKEKWYSIFELQKIKRVMGWTFPVTLLCDRDSFGSRGHKIISKLNVILGSF